MTSSQAACDLKCNVLIKRLFHAQREVFQPPTEKKGGKNPESLGFLSEHRKGVEAVSPLS